MVVLRVLASLRQELIQLSLPSVQHVAVQFFHQRMQLPGLALGGDFAHGAAQFAGEAVSCAYLAVLG